MAPVELEVTITKPTVDTKCGFILESDYEGDEGHPRIGNVQQGSISADHLVKGDIVLEINRIAVTNHNQAAKIIKGASGEILIKVRAKKLREVKAAKTGLFSKSKSTGVDKQVAAADKAAAEQAAAEHAAVMAAAEKAAAVKAAAARAAAAAAEKAVVEKAAAMRAADMAAEQAAADEAAALERKYKPMMDQFIGECRQSAKVSEQGAVAAAASKAAAGAVNAAAETASKAQGAIAGIGAMPGAVVNGTKDFFQDKVVKPVDKNVVQPIKKSIDGTKAKVQEGFSPGKGSQGDAAKAEAEKAAKAAKADAKEAADAATKMQAIRRGQQSRKAVAAEAPGQAAAAPRAATEEEKRWMRESFDKYDDNGSGKLDHKELRNALNFMGMNMDTNRARAMLIKFDEDQSGLMEFEEFVQLSLQLKQVDAELGVAGGGGTKATPTSPSQKISVTGLVEGMGGLLKKAGSTLTEPFALCTGARPKSAALPGQSAGLAGLGTTGKA
jgi:hypothetical protein